MLEKLFKLQINGTSIRTELIAGLSIFLAMSYILFVNPTILSITGMDKGSVFVATCLAAGIGSILMGCIANYPIALAPGMGLNTFFTYTVVLQMGYNWKIALGAVFISALIFFLISICKIRELIINCIPLPLQSGITAGIGLFLSIIALQHANIIVSNPKTLISLGDLTQSAPLCAILGFITIVVLEYRKIPGSILIGIFIVTLLSIIIDTRTFSGILSMPPSIKPTFLQLDILGALDISLTSVIFSFLFIDIFDNSGTLIGVLNHTAYLIDDKEKIYSRINKALVADSLAAIFGSLVGTSTTTSYVESSVGVSAGGRTGLTSVVVGILFFFSLFLSPLYSSVPNFATAPAIFFVSILMISSLQKIDWKDITVAAPVTVSALTMPLTYSISNGITFGFITWTIVKILTGRFKDLNIELIIISLLFIIKFAYFKI